MIMQTIHTAIQEVRISQGFMPCCLIKTIKKKKKTQTQKTKPIQQQKKT